MKKIISTVLVCVLLLGCVLSLASCSKMLMGKYEVALTDDNKTTYEFTPLKVTRTTSMGALGFSKTETTEGKYKIAENDKGELEISFTWEGSEDVETYSFSRGEEDGVEYIKLGLIKLNKVK